MERGSGGRVIHAHRASSGRRLLRRPGLLFVVGGDTAKARIADEDFFALWKSADPDVPVLKQAYKRKPNMPSCIKCSRTLLPVEQSRINPAMPNVFDRN
jgi:hypothetical protein